MKKFILLLNLILLLTCNIDNTLRNNPLDVNGNNYSVPAADFTINGALTANIFLPATLDAGISVNPKASILVYRWDYTNDGIWDTSFSQSKVSSYSYTVAGNYNCKLEVKNEEGYSDSAVKNFNAVNSQNPVAAFTYSPIAPGRNGTVTFDASGSTDDDTAQANLLVRWDFENDGVFDNNWNNIKTASHIYTAPGSMTVKLEVKDQYGLVNGTTKSFTIADSQAPVANFTVSPSSPSVGGQITFDASTSTDDDTAVSALEVRWDFENDGSFDTAWSTTKIATHIYITAGNYTVKLEVRDSFGIVGTSSKAINILSSYSRNITIHNNSNNNLNNFQVELDLTNANFDFSKAATTGADIRFYADSTKIPYCIESWDNYNQRAVVWVKINTINANSSYNIQIISYFGNSNYLSESDGNSVFDFYDDFSLSLIDPNKWTVYGSQCLVSEGKLIITNVSDSHISSKISFTKNIILESSTWLPSFNASFLRCVPSGLISEPAANVNSSSTKSGLYFYGDNNSTTTYSIIDTFNNYSAVCFTPQNVSTKLSIIFSNTTTEFFVDDVSKKANQPIQLNPSLYIYIGNDRLPTFSVDWVRVRKYATIAPVVSYQ